MWTSLNGPGQNLLVAFITTMMTSIKTKNFMNDTKKYELRVLWTMPWPVTWMLIINNKSYISSVDGCGLYSSGYYRVLTMVYNTQRYWVFGLCPSSRFEITKNTTFQKLDLFPSRYRSSFRNVVFLIISNPDNGQSPKTQYLCTHLVQYKN
jgi:hypothetical protein